MSRPKLDNIWLEEFQGKKALRADFSNERHHRVVIQWPHGNEELAQALMDLALNIRRDNHLTDLEGGAADPTLHVADTRYPMRTTGGGVICLGGDNHLTDLEGEVE